MSARKPAKEAHAKGTLLVNLKAYVEKHEGAPRWRGVVDSLDAADRAVLDGMVLVGGWYSVGVWNRVVDKFLSGSSDPGREMIEIARYTADHDLNSLFKALLRMGTPAFILGRTDSLWRRYFDVGELRPKQLSPRQFELSLDAPANIDLAAGPWVCNQGVSGWLTQALELTGADQPQVTHLRCRFQGAPRCEYQARW